MFKTATYLALGLTFLESFLRAHVKSSLTCRAVNYHFRDKHCQMGKIGVLRGQHCHPSPF